MGPSSNWCGALLMYYIFSGKMCGDFCGGVLVAQLWVIKMVSSCIVLLVLFGCRYDGDILSGFCVSTLSSGAGYFSTLSIFTGRGL